MSTITNTVLKRGESRFNMVGQKLPDTLHDTDDKISDGLVSRLHRYAIRRLSDSGFSVEGWGCEVYTMDGELRPSERYYVVEFINGKGGKIGVQGIGTNKGHPHIDHGLCIADE